MVDEEAIQVSGIDPQQLVTNSRQEVQATAMGSLQDDPEKAARAIQISKASNIPAPIVHGDLENYELEHKAMLTSELLKNNKYLAQFVLNDPMAAKVANDSWGALDLLSDKVVRMGTNTVLSKAFEAFKTGYDLHGQQEEWDKLRDSMWPSVATHPVTKTALLPVLAIDTLFRGFTGATYAAAEAVAEAARQSGMGEAEAARLTRDIVAGVQVGLSGQAHGLKAPHAEAFLKQAQKIQNEARQGLITIRPWLEVGEEPPVGVHPLVDKAKGDQIKIDIDNLSEAEKEAQKNPLHERSPDMLANFIRQHGDTTIAITPEAVAKLYGDKAPVPGDGILGDFLTKERLDAALAAGDDIAVSRADWLAKVDPETAKALRDNVRMRREGLTLEEVKDLGDQAMKVEEPKGEPTAPPAEPAPPVDTVRKAAGLEKDKLLRLQKTESVEKTALSPIEGGIAHGFNLVDDKGFPRASLTLTESPTGKTLFIDEVTATDKSGMAQWRPNLFGPSTMMDVLAQLREAFPKAEHISGVRISGAREKARPDRPLTVTTISLKNPTATEMAQFVKGWTEVGPAATAKSILPPTAETGGTFKAVRGEAEATHTFSVNEALDQVPVSGITDPSSKAVMLLLEAKLREAVGDVKIRVLKQADIDRLMGNKEGVETAGFYTPPVHEIAISEGVIQGRWQDIGREVVFHEAVHAWSSLAIHANPILKDHINKVLAEVKAELKDIDPKMLREHEYKLSNETEFFTHLLTNEQFRKDMSLIKISDKLAAEIGLGKGPHTIWDAVREFMKGMLEKLMGGPVDASAVDAIFHIAKRVEAARETGHKALRGSREFGMEGPMDERAPFGRGAIDRTVKEMERYIELLAKRQAEDFAAALARAEKEQKRKQTAEWKENEKVERDEALEKVNSRPDVAADNYLRYGELFGQKVERMKLATDSVTKEALAILPREYFTAKGVLPDDIAGMFGYHSGQAMLEALVAQHEAVKASGLRPMDYKRALIRQEVDRKMQEKYGKLGENVLDEAKNQAISETELDLLHQDVLRYASRAGLEYTIDKEGLRKAIKDAFADLPVAEVSREKYLAASGRAHRLVERNLLEDKPGEALKEAQKQYTSMANAFEAKLLHEEQKDLTKTHARFQKRQVSGVEQEFTNFIHDLFVQADLGVRGRSVNDIAREIEKHKTGATLAEFVEYHNKASPTTSGWEITVAPDILAGKVKPMDQMTVAEFREFKNAIDSLAYVGREIEKIEIAGVKEDFADFKKDVIGNITQMPVRTPKNQREGGEKIQSFLYGFDASLTRIEEMVKDLDLRQELGPLYRAIVDPMMSAKHKEYLLQEALEKKLKEMKGDYGKDWQRSLKDDIPQTFFHDAYYNEPFQLTRENMINIMLNWGNRSNINKFVRGYFNKNEWHWAEQQFTDLFNRHATKADWEFVQQMWDIFEGWRPDSDTLYRNLSGISPKWIKPDEVVTPHGNFKGGYWPLSFDEARSDILTVKEKQPGEGLFKGDYHRATTANRYTLERTGVAKPVDFLSPIDLVATRMQQQIHDIAYRTAVMQVAKVIFDKDIAGAMRKHYGEEYQKQFKPWLEDVANHFNLNPKELEAWEKVMRWARLNLSGHALGLNLKVMMSPDVGQFNPKVFGRYLADREGFVKFAMEKSQEIPHTYRNIDRDYRERMEQLIQKAGFDTYRAEATKMAFAPLVWVSQHFRIMTFVDEFQKGMARGLNEKDAISIADSMVRTRHGSSGVVDLSAVMRSNEFMKVSTVFYGYFNMMQNWIRQLPGAARRGDYKEMLKIAYGTVAISFLFNATLFTKREKDESLPHFWAKALFTVPGQNIPFIRDVQNKFVENFPIRSPLVTLYDAVEALGKDVVKLIKKERPKKPIQHAANVIGLGLGIPGMGQIGRSGQFLADVATGEQKPKGIMEWFSGLVYGEAKPK